jgi:hypothetical protein
MHYAILTQSKITVPDTYGGTETLDKIEYLVMPHNEILDWIKYESRDKDYKVLEVYPMTVSTTTTLCSSKWDDDV